MRILLRPTYGFLLSVIFGLLLFVDITVPLAVWTPSLNDPVFWVPVGLIILLVFLYLVYGVTYFSWKILNDCGGFKPFCQSLREQKLFRKIVFSYLGSFLNLLMSILYFVQGCASRSLFDLLAAQYLFSGFIIRSVLLYITFNGRKDWEIRGFRLASWFTIFFGLAMLALTFVYNFSGIVITRSYLFTFILGIYALAKIVAATVSLRAAVHDKDVSYLSYTIIAMSLAFYTLFMFVVTVPVSESVEEAMPRDAFIGYFFSAVTIMVGIICLLYYLRIKKRGFIMKEETVLEEKEGVFEKNEGVLEEKPLPNPDKRVVKVLKKKE